MKKTTLFLALLGAAIVPQLEAMDKMTMKKTLAMGDLFFKGKSKDEKQQALIAAIADGKIATAIYLLISGNADANGMCNSRPIAYPLITRAVEREDHEMEMVQLLLDHRASVDAVSQSYDSSMPDGFTTLMSACSNKKEPLVALLLKHKADVNKHSSTGTSALISSCRMIFINREAAPRITTLILLHPELTAHECCHTYSHIEDRQYFDKVRRALYHAQEAEKAGAKQALWECSSFSRPLITIITDYITKPHLITPEYPLLSGEPTDAELKEAQAALKRADETYSTETARREQ